MQANNHQAHVEAAKVAQLEAAQAAAQEALMQEMELLRRQKHGAEQHARDLEEQVSDVDACTSSGAASIVHFTQVSTLAGTFCLSLLQHFGVLYTRYLLASLCSTSCIPL